MKTNNSVTSIDLDKSNKSIECHMITLLCYLGCNLLYNNKTKIKDGEHMTLLCEIFTLLKAKASSNKVIPSQVHLAEFDIFHRYLIRKVIYCHRYYICT